MKTEPKPDPGQQCPVQGRGPGEGDSQQYAVIDFFIRRKLRMCRNLHRDDPGSADGRGWGWLGEKPGPPRRRLLDLCTADPETDPEGRGGAGCALAATSRSRYRSWTGPAPDGATEPSVRSTTC